MKKQDERGEKEKMNYGDEARNCQKLLDTMDAKGWTNFTGEEVQHYLRLMKKRDAAKLFHDMEVKEYHEEETFAGLL